MSTRAERIRAILEKQDAPKENSGSKKFGAVYPFWNLKHGTQSVVRFLPDGDSSNTLPWVENQQINLSFPGIVGESPRGVTFKVPCMEMFGLADPILGHIRKEKWFDDEDTKAMGSKYWKKYSYLMQGFIIQDGLSEEEPPESPIRRFVFSKQVFGPIRSGYADPDFDEAVDDYQEGIDFNIRCEANGEWNNYSTSGFKHKSRSLTEEEMAAITEHGLGDLKEFRPKQPTDSEVHAIFEMFEASVAGEFYDPNRWGHLPWRPRGVEANGATTPAAKPAPSAVAAAAAATTTVEAAATPDVTESKTTDTQAQANAILERIRQG